ncbi:MAG: hypothetical protein ACHQ4J_13510 [Candidatus Binatia bacterium]
MRSLIADMPDGKTRPTIKPEERLLLAVVESAYWDLQSPDPVRRRTARHYFLDEADQHTFSFMSICQHFSWSPASIRNQLRSFLHALAPADGVQWPEAGARSAPPSR